MIIDTESHVIYRVFPLEANPQQSMVQRTSWHEHSSDLFAAEMARSGVDHAFLISYDGEDVNWYLRNMANGVPEDFLSGRKYALSQIKRHPNQFFWFATLKDPRRSDIMELVERDLADGVLGFKIFANWFPLPVSDPSFQPIYRRCAETGRRLIFAFEYAKAPLSPTVGEYFLQLEAVMKEFPELFVQVNHAGSVDPLSAEAADVFEVTRRVPNLRLSTAMLAMEWPDESEYPFMTYLQRLEKLYLEVGVDKLMWATDWPWLEEHMTYPQAVNCIRRHAWFLNEEDKNKFLGVNAWQFIKDLVPAYRSSRLFSTSHD